VVRSRKAEIVSTMRAFAGDDIRSGRKLQSIANEVAIGSSEQNERK
jgi:hypothetical protein